MIYLSQNFVCTKNTFKVCRTMQVYINVFNRQKLDTILRYSKRFYEIVPREEVI